MYSLQELADRDAIRELLARYCYFHAAHDFDAVVALFTDDGCFDSIGGMLTGHAAIKSHYLRIVPDKSANLERKHYVTDSLIELNGDEAAVMSQFLLVRQAGDSLMVATAGRYEDVVLKTSAGWRFKRRKVHLDFSADLGLKKT